MSWWSTPIRSHARKWKEAREREWHGENWSLAINKDNTACWLLAASLHLSHHFHWCSFGHSVNHTQNFQVLKFSNQAIHEKSKLVLKVWSPNCELKMLYFQKDPVLHTVGDRGLGVLPKDTDPLTLRFTHGNRSSQTWCVKSSIKVFFFPDLLFLPEEQHFFQVQEKRRISI